MAHDNTVFVGLDVHKDSIVAACSVGFGEVASLGNIGVLQRDIQKLCQRMQSKASELVFVYEAGPCGYGLQRQLQRAGFTCHVCAPSLIPRKAGDRVKTDRRDAEKLVRALRAGDLSFVHVPDEHDEAFRDLVRAWNGARLDLRQAKQRLKSFLLVHGVRYSGNADWKDAHRRWLSRFSFAEPWSQMAFEEHRRTVEDRQGQCQRLEQLLRKEASQWRLFPVIEALQALRGVQFIVAVGLAAEIGDMIRFDNPRKLMDWIGLVPSEQSTGERIRKGGITKAGNGLVRKLLIEAAWSYRYSPKVSPIIQRRHEGLSQEIIDRAWAAQLRLCRRFRRLQAKGKHRNTVVTAIARELAGFVWDIARRTQPAN